MSGITLNYQLIDSASDRLLRMAGANTQPLMDEIGAQQLASVMWRFENEQAPDGTAWKKSRRAEAEGGKTLQDRGHLRDSYTYLAGNDEVEIGSNMIYAAIHHEGGTIRAKNGKSLAFMIGDQLIQVQSVEIPARETLGINNDDEQEIDDLVQDFYEELIRGH